MPSALETLIKILKQERDTDCENKTVIGGLGAYSDTWQRQAKEQAKRAEHVVLADELVSIMRAYDTLNDKVQRLSRINYMLDRITGRKPVPPQYLEQLQAIRDANPQYAVSPKPTPPPAEERPPRQQRTPDSERQPENTERPARPPRSERPPRAEGEHPAKAERPPRETPLEGETPRAPRDERREEISARPPRAERPPRTDKDKPQEPRAERPPRTDKDKPQEPRAERPPRSARSSEERPQQQARGERARQEGRPMRDERKPRPEMMPRIANDSARENFEFDLKAIDGGEPDLKPLPRLMRPPRQTRTELSPTDAQQRLAELKQPITVIKGVGPKVADTLKPLGIESVEQMIYYLPRRYDDYTRLLPIRSLQPETIVTVVGKIVNTFMNVAQGGRKIFMVTLDDGSGRLTVSFFGGQYLQRILRDGMQIVVSGKVTAFRNTLQMSNPEWEPLDSENLNTIGIVPVYPLKEGIKARSLRRTMKQAIDIWADRVPDYVPLATLERAELADLGWAIRNLHFPAGFDHLHHAQRRHVFNELIVLQLAILGNRRDWQNVPGMPLAVDDGFLDTFIAHAFPYEMTGAQNRAIGDIRRDVGKAVPMNRLIQGDVGAGKTAIAIVAMAMAVHNGKQAALMAPTSILAEQHYRALQRTFGTWQGAQKPVIALLTGALSKSEHDAIYRGIADGSIDIVVGTHALIQEGVEFKDLAVAVVDEQHRFGVQQRARLRGKGYNPHLLVMTATPIPRTLALTIYADLDLTIIDEKPQGRLPITTQINLPVERERIYDFIEAQVRAGRQAFVIHPLVEASEKSESRAAVEAYEELTQVFFDFRVCLLHGRMRPAEKDDIMSAFARHEYDIMVTTSVAEVGVDIPNASVILIEGANRFGLAQLHQFRGRVGRGEHPSWCVLMVEPDIFTLDDLADADAGIERDWTEVQKRLVAMQNSDDGFVLAELDWKLRGAGDLLGARQSGQSALQLAELMTPDLVALAQREAYTIYEEDPPLALERHHLLRQMVQMQIRTDSDQS